MSAEEAASRVPFFFDALLRGKSAEEAAEHQREREREWIEALTSPRTRRQREMRTALRLMGARTWAEINGVDPVEAMAAVAAGGAA